MFCSFATIFRVPSSFATVAVACIPKLLTISSWHRLFPVGTAKTTVTIGAHLAHRWTAITASTVEYLRLDWVAKDIEKLIGTENRNCKLTINEKQSKISCYLLFSITLSHLFELHTGYYHAPEQSQHVLDQRQKWYSNDRWTHLRESKVRPL